MILKRFKTSPEMVPLRSLNFLTKLIEVESGKATFTFFRLNFPIENLSILALFP